MDENFLPGPGSHFLFSLSRPPHTSDCSLILFRTLLLFHTFTGTAANKEKSNTLCHHIARIMIQPLEEDLVKPLGKDLEECDTSISTIPEEASTPLHIGGTDNGEASMTAGELDNVQNILSQLTVDEIETAALACYEYLKHPEVAKREYCAKRIILRYVRSKKNATTALHKLRATLSFRKSMDIVGLIKCFDEDPSGNYAVSLKKQMASKKMYVQGYDKSGRATLFFIPRLTQGHDSEWTLKEAVYSIERAIACSKSPDGLINAVVDFSGFAVTKHAPPLDIGKQFLTTLRNHYAGQIHRIFLLDTPGTFSLFWKIFQPFIGSKTKAKIQFLSGSKKSKLGELYNEDEVPSWMLRGGKRNLELNLDEYLMKIPFHRAFDELDKEPAPTKDSRRASFIKTVGSGVFAPSKGGTTIVDLQ